MDTWTPGPEERATILGLARDAERLTSVVEGIVPNLRTGDRKRKIAHIIACCEASFDALEWQPKPAPATEPGPEAPSEPPEPDSATNPGAYNRKRIAEAVEEAAKAAGE